MKSLVLGQLSVCYRWKESAGGIEIEIREFIRSESGKHSESELHLFQCDCTTSWLQLVSTVVNSLPGATTREDTQGKGFKKVQRRPGGNQAAAAAGTCVCVCERKLSEKRVILPAVRGMRQQPLDWDLCVWAQKRLLQLHAYSLQGSARGARAPWITCGYTAAVKTQAQSNTDLSTRCCFVK